MVVRDQNLIVISLSTIKLFGLYWNPNGFVQYKLMENENDTLENVVIIRSGNLNENEKFTTRRSTGFFNFEDDFFEKKIQVNIINREEDEIQNFNINENLSEEDEFKFNLLIKCYQSVISEEKFDIDKIEDQKYFNRFY